MADLSAVVLGERNTSTRSEMVSEVQRRQQRQAEYLSDRLAPGTSLSLTTLKGASAVQPEIMAVMKAGGSNINRELVSQGLARYREDVGGAEGQAMHGVVGRMLGRMGETASFTDELFGYALEVALNYRKYQGFLSRAALCHHHYPLPPPASLATSLQRFRQFNTPRRSACQRFDAQAWRMGGWTYVLPLYHQPVFPAASPFPDAETCMTGSGHDTASGRGHGGSACGVTLTHSGVSVLALKRKWVQQWGGPMGWGFRR